MELEWFNLLALVGAIRVDATTITLAVIAAILGLLLLKKTYEERIAASTPAGSSAAMPGGTTDEVDPRLLVVLTAAAAMVAGRPVAVRRITFINRDTVSGWAEAGRTSIHLSHNPRRN
jgi:hypothetical protein